MILLATASASALTRYTECLHAFGLVLPLSHQKLLLPALTQLRPAMLLLDYGLPGLNGVEAVGELHQLEPAAKIIVLGNRLSPDIKLELFIAGISGYCNLTSEPQQIVQLITAVKQGELCMPRALIPSLLARLCSQALHANTVSPADMALPGLTRREREISLLVGSGHCNKEIARTLGIAERTVKSHLTEIFRKLGIGDRLTLALRLAAAPQLAAANRLTLVSASSLPTRLSA